MIQRPFCSSLQTSHFTTGKAQLKTSSKQPKERQFITRCSSGKAMAKFWNSNNENEAMNQQQIAGGTITASYKIQTIRRPPQITNQNTI